MSNKLLPEYTYDVLNKVFPKNWGDWDAAGHNTFVRRDPNSGHWEVKLYDTVLVKLFPAYTVIDCAQYETSTSLDRINRSIRNLGWSAFFDIRSGDVKLRYVPGQYNVTYCPGITVYKTGSVSAKAPEIIPGD